MTVAPLPTTPPRAWLDAAEAALDHSGNPARLSAEAARAESARLSRFMARLAARNLALIRVIDESDLAKKTGATSTSTLIAVISGVIGPVLPVRCMRHGIWRRRR